MVIPGIVPRIGEFPEKQFMSNHKGTVETERENSEIHELQAFFPDVIQCYSPGQDSQIAE
jgi:hypothetical protein